MVNNLLYLALLCEMADCDTGEAAVYFETFDEDALADEAESGDFLEDAIVGWLVEGDGVLGLVLDLSLGPLLLLCRLSSR